MFLLIISLKYEKTKALNQWLAESFVKITIDLIFLFQLKYWVNFYSIERKLSFVGIYCQNWKEMHIISQFIHFFENFQSNIGMNLQISNDFSIIIHWFTDEPITCLIEQATLINCSSNSFITRTYFKFLKNIATIILWKLKGENQKKQGEKTRTASKEWDQSVLRIDFESLG